jgi:DNA-binding NarL/FixJ family response regulator
MNRRPRVFLADDHTMLLDAFRRLLESRCEIVGTAADGRVLLELVAEARPDVIVLDISMPRLNGMDAFVQLRQRLPNVKFVFLTVNEDADTAAHAINLGASGYLLKKSASGELFAAIEHALAGKTFVTPLITKGIPLGVFLGSSQEIWRGKAHGASTRNAPTSRRRLLHEGDRGLPEGDRAHGGLSQVHDHGAAWHQDDGRARPICRRAWNLAKARVSS